MANKKNLANGILASSITSSATSMTLESGYGAGMPDTPFSLTITPPGQLSTLGNSEIVTVTARTGDVLTITRAQKSTVAKAFSAGAVVANGVYADDKVEASDIAFTSTNQQVTGVYDRFHNTGNLSATSGNSYSRTANLPRAVQSGEEVILIPNGMRWCTAQLMSWNTTQFTFELHNTITTSGMSCQWSAIYFKKI